MIFRTQDDWNIIHPIFGAMSISPQLIFYSDRTIDAPVTCEGILEMEGASGLPLATTLKLVANAGADDADAAGAGAGASTGPADAAPGDGMGCYRPTGLAGNPKSVCHCIPTANLLQDRFQDFQAGL